MYSVLWDDCIVDPRVIYITAGLVIACFVMLAYTMYTTKTFVALRVPVDQAENTLATSSGKVVAKVKILLGFLLSFLPWVDTITDFKFNLEIQYYLDKQTQFNCDTFNQKGIFDSTGFLIDGKPYPSASEYENFNEYVQKILVYFQLISLNEQIQDSNVRCLSANMPSPLPPDCEYNAAKYACVPVTAWVHPFQLFR